MVDVRNTPIGDLLWAIISIVQAEEGTSLSHNGTMYGEKALPSDLYGLCKSGALREFCSRFVQMISLPNS
jgi:hypothetical protein